MELLNLKKIQMCFTIQLKKRQYLNIIKNNDNLSKN